MKIIHVSTAISWRGGEQQLVYLLKALSAQNVDQEVFCVKYSPVHVFCRQNNIPCHTFSKDNSMNVSTAALLGKLCRDQKQILVHTHDSHAHNMAFISAIFFRNKVPVIVHRRVDFRVSPNIFSRVKYNHPIIKRYICVSEAIRTVLASAINDPGKIKVVHSGIDVELYHNTKRNGLLRKEFGIDESSPLIGNFSALAPHKDYPTFLRTAALLLQRNPGYRFVIAGDGPLREETLMLIKTMELEDKVFYAGFRTNIPEIIKDLDVFLITSRTEGLGTVILDALASGIPVVATRVGGIPEVIEHRITGFLAPQADVEQLAIGVEEMIHDTGLRNTIINNALEKVKQFDYRLTGSRTLDVYREIIEEREPE
jgi:L-malate glycosyltransferase